MVDEAVSIYYKCIVSDNNTTVKKYLKYLEKRPRDEVTIGGRLPKEIPISKWFIDPGYCIKCVAGKFFNYNKMGENRLLVSQKILLILYQM